MKPSAYFHRLLLITYLISNPLIAATADSECLKCHKQSHLAIAGDIDDSHKLAQLECLSCHNPTRSDDNAEHYGHLIVLYPSEASCQACHKK